MSLHPTHPIHYAINVRGVSEKLGEPLTLRGSYEAVHLNYQFLKNYRETGELEANRVLLVNASLTGLLLNFKIKTNE